MRFIFSVRVSITSLALLMAASMAVMRAACSAAVVSSIDAVDLDFDEARQQALQHLERRLFEDRIVILGFSGSFTGISFFTESRCRITLLNSLFNR